MAETVTHLADEHRFELTIDNTTAFISYRPIGDVLVFEHTEVPPELGGKGVGSRLVHEALNEVRKLGLKIRPDCSFVAAYIKRHPEFADLASGV